MDSGQATALLPASREARERKTREVDIGCAAGDFPEPRTMVQPSVPWPVLRNRFLYGVAPITGGLSGVIGRRPAQGSASVRSPTDGKRSRTTCASVARRA